MIELFFVSFWIGLFKAVRDTISFHFETSLFFKLKGFCRDWMQSKWEFTKPRQGKLTLFLWFLWDGWHFFETALTISWVNAIVFFVRQFANCQFEYLFVGILLMLGFKSLIFTYFFHFFFDVRYWNAVKRNWKNIYRFKPFTYRRL